MEEDVLIRKSRFQTLQKRLKDERLYVKYEKDTLRKLNEKLVTISRNLFCLEWKNRQNWINIDRLVWGGNVNPSECSNTSRIIESVKFEDAASYLNYEDHKYGSFLKDLRENPRLVALLLDFCDKRKLQTSTRLISRLLISSLYGGCADQRDELCILLILKELIHLQVLTCEDLLSFFIGKRANENAFACVFTMYAETLFSSKLYLTAALHGTVMQVIVGDNTFLDVEINKVLNRFHPKTVLEKFGQPGSEQTNNKIKEHMKKIHNQLITLCKKFLKSLHDKLYCFPESLRWTFGKLYQGMLDVMKLPQANAKAIIGYVIMSYFICPAIINPEPFGINSDADISETARHNLGQIASILKSVALLECGLKDERLKSVLEDFEAGTIMSYVTSLLKGSENINIEKEYSDSTIKKCSVLITEKDLKTLIACLKHLKNYNCKELKEEGLEELLESLPPPPRRWTKDVSLERNVKSMPPNTKFNVEATPSPPPRHKKLKKQNSDFASTETLNVSDDEVNKLRKDLKSMVKADEPVLVVPLGTDTQIEPGSLPEEKVLGLNKEPQSPNAFDLYSTNEDKKRRASSVMLDALRDVFTDKRTAETASLGSLSSSSSDDLLDMKVIKSKNEEKKQNDPLLDNVFIDKQFSNSQPVNSTPNRVVPVDTLLSLDNNEEEMKPKLPEKKHSQRSLSNMAIDEPLVNLDNDIFENNVSSTPSHSNADNRMSNLSLLNSTGGINDILKNAEVPTPTTVRNSEFQDPWSPTVLKQVDPWGFNQTIENSNGLADQSFENSFSPLNNNFNEKSSPMLPKKNSPSSKKKHTIDPKYAEYTEAIQRDHLQNLSKSPSDKHEIEESNFKQPYRKKSHGAWIKNKITTGFRSTIKQDGKPPIENKEVIQTDTKAIYKALSHSQNIGTPAQASEDSRAASMSVLSRHTSNSLTSGMDESESILEKYRMLTLGSGNASNLDQSFSNANFVDTKSVEEKIVFDEEYKFNDAKKKLRTVLSASDHLPLPSENKSFDHLMMIMLQGKLAEAVNLQDRFSVAQLHETLRSIKQLPTGSCEKLIVELEKDYKGRSAYISYLVRSKQGLLSTISHIEQMTAKMERDRVICNKYFTTLSVRLYLETDEKKREIQVFAYKFASTKMLDEKCALLNDFLDKINADMLKDPTWTYSTNEQINAVQLATERAIMSRIYKEAFYPNSVADTENDKVFQEHIASFSNVITPNHPALLIPKMYQKEAPWPSAQTELLMVNAYKTAADKLACIHRCLVTIINLLSMSGKQAPGADDIVPVLVYVVLKSNPPSLLSTKQYVNTFYETRLNGEEYYCWMQFCSAIEYIKTMRISGNP